MQRGWIKLWRKLQDLTLWSYSDEPFCKRAAWIDLLLMTWAKEKEFFLNAKTVTLKPGQMIVSFRFLAAKWRWSPEKLKNYLKLLVELKMIERKVHKYGTLITICNWEIYQQNFKADDTPTDTPTNTPTDTLTERSPAQNKECKRRLKNNSKQSQPSAASQKVSRKELQNRDIEKTRSLWKDVFGFEVEPSFVQVLVYGAKTGRRKLIGFGTFKGLQLWIEAMRGKDIENPKEYVWKVAQIEANVRHWRKLGHSTPSTIGEVFEKEILGGGPR